MEDVPLVEVDGDEGLELPTVNLGQVLCGDINKGVQNVEKLHICASHDLLV